MNPSDTQSPLIKTYHTKIPSQTPSGPTFIFHLTRLTSTLFIWIGTSTSSQFGSSSNYNGPSSGMGIGGMDDDNGIGQQGGSGLIEGGARLAGEWGVAMPTRGNTPSVATPIFRSGTSDLSVPMAQRLARKYPSNQIHLSLSLPLSLTASSGPSLDPYASRTILIMEKEICKWLDKVLAE